jgi:lipopolysaccharide/colanic/teichoic acid biosynthesis glycosyltransferase
VVARSGPTGEGKGGLEVLATTSDESGTSNHVLAVPEMPVRLVAQDSAIDTPIDDAAEPHRATRYEEFVKPAIDATVGTLLLLASLWLIVLVAIAVRIRMGRGVIFKQARVGRTGRPFTMYKFRTMAPDRRHEAASYDEPERRKTHKHPNDPRLTPLGRFLRKWSLDELPQLWNVVRGEMSLVGPRPEMLGIVDTYDQWQHGRHAVKPGLTGLWQVSARGDGPMHENTHLDLAYVRQVRFGSDCKILLMTIPALLGRQRGF